MGWIAFAGTLGLRYFPDAMAKRHKGQRPKRKPARAPKVNPLLVEQGMLKRVLERVSLSASVKVPAVPAMAEHYSAMCERLSAALGRGFGKHQHERALAEIAGGLERAFAFSQRSRLEIRFMAAPSAPLNFEVHAEARSLADSYDRWLGDTETELFGQHGDARILSLAAEPTHPASNAVLDFGAGTGRNALALARLGHAVDAVEITSRFARMIRDQAKREALAVRVVEADVLSDPSQLQGDYRMVFASEVASDFRDPSELRRLFRLASERLAEGGLLVFNAHLAWRGYTPDRATREFAQHCYSAIYTTTEIARACEGLPFEWVASDSAVQYEREHLPADAWPPTPWFQNWATGRDIFELTHGSCPVEVYWLVFEKTQGSVAEPTSMARAIAEAMELEARTKEAGGAEPVCLVPATLRQAVLARLRNRTIARGEVVLPALPALGERLARCCFETYQALGREFSEQELGDFRQALGTLLAKAFATSLRSNVVVDFQLPMGSELKFELSMDAPSIEEVYESWYQALPPPLFGEHADARVVLAAQTSELAPNCPVLDLGAGLGRNALFLAERGHAVDAVEITPRFADELTSAAQQRGLPVRVLAGSFFDSKSQLRDDYGLIVCAGAVADLRSPDELRQLFELAARSLSSGGWLVMSVHVAAKGYDPPVGLRQWAQQCSATCFTERELDEASEGLGLERVSNESAYDFERSKLPADAWPPTAVFEEWALGQHLVACSRPQAPLELRWLVYRSRPGNHEPSPDPKS